MGDVGDMGDKVCVKVTPYQYVIKFIQKRKLVLRFVRPFKILDRIGKVAY